MRIAAFLIVLVLLGGCASKPRPAENDRDGDFLFDESETQGWDIDLELTPVRCLSDEAPVKTSRHVTSDPSIKDTDSDGLSDDEEFTLGSDPHTNDTDADGLTDKAERDLNAKGQSGFQGDLRLDRADTDRDCLPDSNETRGLEVPGYGLRKTDPTQLDTDHDGLPDSREVFATGTDPMNPDTDYDGLNDFIDGDPLHNLGLKLTFERFKLKSGNGPVRFNYGFDGPTGPVRPSSPPSVAISSGENKTVPSGSSPGSLDVQDTKTLYFQIWVQRGDGSFVDVTPGDAGTIIEGVVDPKNRTWDASGRKGPANGDLFWFNGPEGELGLRLEVVYL